MPTRAVRWRDLFKKGLESFGNVLGDRASSVLVQMEFVDEGQLVASARACKRHFQALGQSLPPLIELIDEPLVIGEPLLLDRKFGLAESARNLDRAGLDLFKE